MQTRRDQLQAYRFQNRRALAALVTGRPNIVEPPMRRLTVTTIAGIAIAILIGVVFALLSLFKPTTGDAWKQAGVVIEQRDSAAIYVYINDVLHPVLNYPSAVLAVGSKGRPTMVDVDASDIRGARRGSTIGIDNIPLALPDAANLVKPPWTVCSRLHAGAGGTVTTQVSMLAGSTGGASLLAQSKSAFVVDVTSGKRYVLEDGTRYPVASDTVATLLNLPVSDPLQVGTAFLNAIPAGPGLAPPAVPGAGTPAGSVGGKVVKIGQVIHTDDTKRDYLRLGDGIAELDPLQSALLSTLLVNGAPLPGVNVNATAIAVAQLTTSTKDWPPIRDSLAGLPSSLPSTAQEPANNGGLCVEFTGPGKALRLAVPANSRPQFIRGVVTESANSRRGLADTVAVPSGGVALVKSDTQAKTLYLVGEPGKKFPLGSTDVLTSFGYTKVKPTSLPSQLLLLLQQGPVLDSTGALRPVTG